jgi:hypothetical protein
MLNNPFSLDRFFNCMVLTIGTNVHFDRSLLSIFFIFGANISDEDSLFLIMLVMLDAICMRIIILDENHPLVKS